MRAGVVAARWTAIVAFIVGSVVGLVLGRSPRATLVVLLAVTAYAAVGWVIARRKPGNAIGWLFLAVAALTGLAEIGDGLSRRAIATDDSASLMGQWGGWLLAAVWIPLICCAMLFPLQLFPDGLPSRRWRPLLWASAAACLLVTLKSALATPLELEGTTNSTGGCLGGIVPKDGGCSYAVDNPLGVSRSLVSATSSDALRWPLAVCLASCVLLSLVSVVLRFRRSQGVQRLQMRWFALSAVAVGLFVLNSIVSTNGPNPLWREIVMSLVIASIPVSCGIAIMRYHLYDIDRIISRAVSYTIVTGLLLAVYGSIVVSASRLLDAKSPMVVAAATLVAAALARPLLVRVQTVVDRRFNRAQYDAHITIEMFGRRLRDELGHEQVIGDLRTVIGETIQPSSQAIWIAPSSGVFQ
jgi:hypothetical protein